MMLPNFLVVGAGKAGTTSLYKYLEQHPEIFMSPVKEPNYFALKGMEVDYRSPDAKNRINKWSVTSLASYQELFMYAEGFKARGEASPLYLYSPIAPKEIKSEIPDAKIIVILRNPTDRAFSSYLHLRKNRRERIASFEMALNEESRRIEDNWEWIWHYTQVGLYGEQLGRYKEYFSKDRILVIFFEDLINARRSTLQLVYRFLNVNENFEASKIPKLNSTGLPKSRFIEFLLSSKHPIKKSLTSIIPVDRRLAWHNIVNNANLTKPEMPRSIRTRLNKLYLEDVHILSKILNKDMITQWNLNKE